jgi:hypothetical protein
MRCLGTIIGSLVKSLFPNLVGDAMIEIGMKKFIFLICPRQVMNHKPLRKQNGEQDF